MSTRCQVAVIDRYTHPERPIMFYRHSDGYPAGVKDSLDAFCELVNSQKIRANDEQAAGWLAFVGMQEYLQNHHLPKTGDFSDRYGEEGRIAAEKLTILNFEPHDWKVGAYEPAASVHGDIEYFHIVLLEPTGSEEALAGIHGKATWRTFGTRRNPSTSELAARIRQVLVEANCGLRDYQLGTVAGRHDPEAENDPYRWPKEYGRDGEPIEESAAA